MQFGNKRDSLRALGGGEARRGKKIWLCRRSHPPATLLGREGNLFLLAEEIESDLGYEFLNKISLNNAIGQDF